MKSWAPYVFIRYCLLLITGILIAYYIKLPVVITAFGFVTVFIAYIIAYVLKRKKWLYRSIILELLLCISLIMSGISLVQIRYPNHHSQNIQLDKNIELYTGKIESYVIVKPNQIQTEIELSKIYDGKNWHRSTGKIIASFAKNSYTQTFAYGTILLIKGNPALLNNPPNPGEFNYKHYLSTKGIYLTHFVKDGNYLKIGYKPSNQLIWFAYNLRNQIDVLFKTYLKGAEEYGLAKALVLGIKDDLQADLKQAYTNAGVIHVLAVSGLHVGLIYGIIEWLLRSLGDSRRRKLVKLLLSLSIVWLFVLVTGFSASVLRAAVMFSFIGIGRNLSRQNAMYNTIALSAFFLLCYNPFFIFDLGFLLSYLAVLGIVYLYPKLYHLFNFDQVLPDNLWKLSCLSIAAQLVTLPLCLYVFHQFPVYFLPANLLIVPASTIVLYGCLLLLAINWLPIVSVYFGKFLNWCIWLMNWFIYKMEALPHAQILGISISYVQMLCLYMLMLGIFLFLFSRIKSGILVAFLSLGVFVSTQAYAYFTASHKGQFVVYYLYNTSAISIIRNRAAVILADSAVVTDSRTLQNKLLPAIWESHANAEYLFLDKSRNSDNITTLKDGNLLVVSHGISILILSKPFKIKPDSKLSLDFVVVRNNALPKLAELINKVHYKQLIIDSSNNAYKIEKWKKANAPLPFNIHFVTKLAAFTAEI